MSISTTVRTATTSDVAVGLASTAVLASNSSRKGAVFTNNSVSDIYLAFGNTAVLNEGVLLIPDGPPFKIDQNCLFTGAVNAISGATPRSLTVTEL